jgi:hypothetical protein
MPTHNHENVDNIKCHLDQSLCLGTTTNCSFVLKLLSWRAFVSWASSCILSGALYVTLQKYFSLQSLVIYFLPTPPIKLNLELQIGVRLQIATHLVRSNYLVNQQQQVLTFALPVPTMPFFFISLKNLGQKYRAKTCAEPNWHVFFFCRVTYSSPVKLPLQAQTEFHTI